MSTEKWILVKGKSKKKVLDNLLGETIGRSTPSALQLLSELSSYNSKGCISDTTNQRIVSISRAKDKLKASHYWNNLFNNLKDEFFLNNSGVPCSNIQLICLGLGSLFNSISFNQTSSTLYQIACISLLQDFLGVSNLNTLIFDPFMTSKDYKTFEHFGILSTCEPFSTINCKHDKNTGLPESLQSLLIRHVKSYSNSLKNSKFTPQNSIIESITSFISKLALTQATLYFMPHCDIELYGQTLLELFRYLPETSKTFHSDQLVSNHQEELISLSSFMKIVIFGNSFKPYELRKASFFPLGIPRLISSPHLVEQLFKICKVKNMSFENLQNSFTSSHMVLHSIPWIKETTLEQEFYECPGAFNDMAILSFNHNIFPKSQFELIQFILGGA